MKTITSFLLLISFVFLLSCNDNPNAGEMKQVSQSSKLDTVVFAVDTFQHVFGKYTSEDELSVIEQPLHASLFRISDQHENRKVLEYAPQPGFLGTDSLVVLSKRIINEPEPTVKTDSLTMVIHVLKDQIHQKVIGKWIQTFFCGGFTGGCSDTIDREAATVIELGYSMDYTEKLSGKVLKTLTYSLKDSTYSYGTKSITRLFILVSDTYENKKFIRKFEYFDTASQIGERKGDFSYIYCRLKN